MICLKWGNKKTNKLFLELPKLLYGDDNPQSLKEEKSILKGTHPISSDLNVYPFVVVDEDKKPLCRALLSVYKNDNIGYVGFFEAENNQKAVKLLFEVIESTAHKLNLKRLLGPINCSIYVGYRFKLDRFFDYFTGEPYNKEYYPTLWENCGFSVCNRYQSYRIDTVSEADCDERLEKILSRYKNRGYEFTNLRKRKFDECMHQIYTILNTRYSEFVGFKPIDYKQFTKMFGSLKFALNYDMVKLAYKDNELKAFCICIPNYKNILLGKFTFKKIMQFLKLRKNEKEYIIMYLGADENCIGLGSALVHYLEKSFVENKCTAIAALIKENSVSAKYYDKKHTDIFNYLLYSKDI